jgi:hypothetical protein
MRSVLEPLELLKCNFRHYLTGNGIISLFVPLEQNRFKNFFFGSLTFCRDWLKNPCLDIAAVIAESRKRRHCKVPNLMLE